MVKGVLAGFWLIFVPVAAGIPFVKKKKDYTLGESFLAGLLLMLAVAQLLILPALSVLLLKIFRKLLPVNMKNGHWIIRALLMLPMKKVSPKLP